MSITDATTSLVTAWTEQSIVPFTAGTLASVTECITEVESKLKRGTLGTSTTPSTTEVTRWLIRAKQELAEIKQFIWKRRYATATGVAGQYRYGLPPDYSGGELSIRDTTNDNPIRLVPNHLFNQYFPDMSEESNDEPTFATIKGNEIWFGPPLAGGEVLELEYQRSGDDNTPSDFSWLPEIERFRCCDFATAEAFRSLHQWEAAGVYDARWNQGLNKAIRADGKKKWLAMGYRCHSIFEAN
jgi:hypothetical protein